MAYEFTVRIEAVKQGKLKGDSTRKGQEDRITAFAYQFSAHIAQASGSGMATGRANYSPVTITKRIGASSPQLLQALATSELLKTVLIEFTQPRRDGTMETFYSIQLSNARIVEIHQFVGPVPNQAGPSADELEEVSFNFERMEVEDKSGKTMAVLSPATGT